MELSKFKTELSKLAGIDFHSPRYRELFKRYFGAENADTDGAEKAGADDAQADEAAETEAAGVTDDIGNDKAEESEGEAPDYAETAKDETELETDAEADKKAGKAAEAKPETAGTDDVGQAESETEVETETEAAAQDSAASASEELFATRLELELVRAGIREDRLETAKRLFMPEFKESGGNVDQIRELIAQYPEWLGNQGGAQGFGMPLGDRADALTNEEKALKRMGINPRE